MDTEKKIFAGIVNCFQFFYITQPKAKVKYEYTFNGTPKFYVLLTKLRASPSGGLCT